MNGPFGLKVELWSMAKEEGLNLDELVASRFGKKDPSSTKSRFERLMVQLGVTVEDLKNVDCGVFGEPEDDYYDDAKKKASQVVTPELRAALDALYNVDPIEKAKRFNKKLDWTDLPYIYPDDPWTIYPDPPDDPEEEGPAVITPTNDGEIKKKLDDEAAVEFIGEEEEEEEDLPPISSVEDDDLVITYGRRGCKRTNDGEIKKKKDDEQMDG